MCTASWSIQKEGYCFFFNRDEQRSRPKAELPSVGVLNGVEYLAPRDPQAGGSWIMVNVLGVTVALLNNYAKSVSVGASGGFKSRGSIPVSFADCCSVAAVEERMDVLDASVYNAFHVVALDATGAAVVYSWDRVELRRSLPPLPMITTSSVRTVEVEGYRKGLFRDLAQGGDLGDAGLDAFQRNTEHADPAFNPVMSRIDAETQCLSVVRVGGGRVDFEYSERIAGKSAFGEEKAFGLKS